MTNLILCGGSGTRLWPVSRTLMPKQFVKFFDKKSLFQLTFQRNSRICKKHLIVSNQEQYFLALDQLEEMNIQNSHYLLEPIAKNTAPAIALACMSLSKDELVLVTPSDHLIKNENEYKKVLSRAKVLAKKGNLVTFGIVPKFAQTGFGYIKAKGEDVLAFCEKPDLETAKKYVEAKNYYWNSGMLCFKVEVFLNELKTHSPKIYENAKKAFKNAKKENPLRIKLEDMEQIPEDSIDYALMEKSKKVKVIKAEISWSDVGSFDALYEEMEKDKFLNTKSKNHININSKNNLIYPSKRKIATIDIEDCIIVDTDDAILISKKGSSEKVRQVISNLDNIELKNTHLKQYRPWGSFTILEESNGYKIKKIEVKPGSRLSLQKHFHRNEHWIVLSGTATVTIEDEITILRPNESTYIKMGQIHRLANEGQIPVVLIEAQVGEYTGEDDIVRIEDDFRRDY